MPNLKRKKQLEQKIKKQVTVEFHNRGASCPSCGYVYSNGFSDVTPLVDDKGQHKPLKAEDPSITVCTRCRKVLRMRDRQLHLVTPVEEMLMNDKEKANIALLREILTMVSEDAH